VSALRPGSTTRCPFARLMNPLGVVRAIRDILRPPRLPHQTLYGGGQSCCGARRVKF
jgi:hypothetical protein